MVATMKRAGSCAQYYPSTMELAGLPGNELIREGLADLSAGRTSTSSLLVLIGADRLRRVGLSIPHEPIDDPEHRLYALLAVEDSDSAHARHHALLRQLVSFHPAPDCPAYSIGPEIGRAAVRYGG